MFYMYGNLNLIKNKIFNDPYAGMLHAVDNIFKTFQGEGKRSEPHSLLTKEDFLFYIIFKDFQKINLWDALLG